MSEDTRFDAWLMDVAPFPVAHPVDPGEVLGVVVPSAAVGQGVVMRHGRVPAGTCGGWASDG